MAKQSRVRQEHDPSVVLLRLREAGFHVAPGIGPTAGKAIRIGLFGAQARVVQDVAEVLLGTLA